MRFVHSSDLQIGKAFTFLDPEVAVLLQNARLEVVNRLGQIATEHEAFTVLLAGDIFDKQQLSNVTIARPIETMRRFSRVTWHLMPGNHDHMRENGLWDRLARMQLLGLVMETRGIVDAFEIMPSRNGVEALGVEI